jgi:hypothetical protein
MAQSRYRLKASSENFQIVDGPDAGKEFIQERIYEAVPAEYADKFEAMPEGSEAAATE